MRVKRFVLGPVQTNCYGVITEQGSAVIIDPGEGAQAILHWLKEENATLRVILLTHGHFDHIGAVQQLAEQTGAPVYVHALDEEMLTDPSKNMSARFGFSALFEGKNMQTFTDGVHIALDDLDIRVMHTPGHTKGSSVFLVEDVMFSGDTLFRHQIGRCDCYGGSLDGMYQSLKNLAALSQNYQILPGHGEPTTLLEERNKNPYMLEALQ